jgi:hypothetical protein
VAEVAAENGERFALLNLECRRPVVLIGSAAVIWSLVDGTRTEAEMLSELRRLYADDLSADTPAQVDAFLAQLQEQGLAEAEA